MIVKVNLYFNLKADDGVKIVNHELLKSELENQVNSYLEETDFTIAGSWWSGNRIQATHITPEEALEYLRTKR